MPTIAGRVDQHIWGRRSHGTVEDGLERFVTGFTIFKAQVITKNHELFRASCNDIDDVRQIDQIGFIDFDQTQALHRIRVQTSFD